MNIAIFSPSQNPYSETFIQAHKNYLKDNVFYYYGTNDIQLEGHPALSSPNERRILNLQKRLFKKPSNFIQETIISKSLRKNKIDVVLAEYGTHAHSILPYIKKAGLPLVVHFHGYDASIKDVVEKHEKYKDVFDYASKVIAVSKKMEQMLLEMGCPENKLIYNVYGPNPEFFTAKPTFSIKQFVAIGRFTDKKAPYYTILAFKKAAEKHPDAKLLFAGNGQLMNMCLNLVRYLKLEDQVELLGVITSEEYRKILSESLAFVQHSITAENGDMEGTPLAVLEASAAGLPVISTIHAGIPDVVINGKTGSLVAEHDVDGMAGYMVQVLENIEIAKQQGAAGKENISANFSLERHISGLQNILKSCLPL